MRKRLLTGYDMFRIIYQAVRETSVNYLKNPEEYFFLSALFLLLERKLQTPDLGKIMSCINSLDIQEREHLRKVLWSKRNKRWIVYRKIRDTFVEMWRRATVTDALNIVKELFKLIQADFYDKIVAFLYYIYEILK